MKPARKISVSIDPQNITKGDVIIIKRTYFDPSAKNKLRTRCTKCDGLFDTELRRMESIDSSGERRLEVRNIPQCKTCRSVKKKPLSFLGVQVIAEPASPITDANRLLPAPKPLFAKGQVLHHINTGCEAVVLEDNFSGLSIDVEWKCSHRSAGEGREEVDGRHFVEGAAS
jgi:hypothetical protein